MKLTFERGRGNKIHILRDGEYIITTDLDFWADRFHCDSCCVSEPDFEEILMQINDRKAVSKAFDFLSRRDYSQKELEQKLLRNGQLTPESAEKAVEKMISLGYVNDRTYAYTLAEHLFEIKKMSVASCRMEMRRRGISGDLAEEILGEFDVDNIQQIQSVVESKYRCKLHTEKGRRQTVAALQRKGFSYADIKTALNSFDEFELDDYEE